MDNEDEVRDRTLDRFRELHKRFEEMQKQCDALSPEQREDVDRRVEEDAPEREFLSQEIITRLLDGSMQPDDAERWLSAVEREMFARAARRMQNG
jgi:hypothetical protein